MHDKGASYGKLTHGHGLYPFLQPFLHSPPEKQGVQPIDTPIHEPKRIRRGNHRICLCLPDIAIHYAA